MAFVPLSCQAMSWLYHHSEASLSSRPNESRFSCGRQSGATGAYAAGVTDKPDSCKRQLGGVPEVPLSHAGSEYLWMWSAVSRNEFLPPTCPARNRPSLYQCGSYPNCRRNDTAPSLMSDRSIRIWAVS